MTDIRCASGKKFGEVREGLIEFKCKARTCGWAPGLVVIHQFDHQGGFVGTRTFAEPRLRKG